MSVRKKGPKRGDKKRTPKNGKQGVPRAKRNGKRVEEFDHDHDSILTVALIEIRPSPENDAIYGVIDPTDQEIIELAQSITEHGLREPLTVTADGYILSGHRRYAASKLAKLSMFQFVGSRCVATTISTDLSCCCANTIDSATRVWPSSCAKN